MYWCVHTDESASTDRSNMSVQNDKAKEQNGGVDMGSKQSTLGNSSLTQSSSFQNIQDAYKAGDTATAQEQIRLLSADDKLKQQKCQLLSIAAAFGDLEMVRYLLKEAKAQMPKEPSDEHPAVLAAYYGRQTIVVELLDTVPSLVVNQEMLTWMLTSACQQGHFELVKTLVLLYSADPESCAVKKNRFPVITGYPLYAAVKSGNEETAAFLLQNGACLSSYILVDHPETTKHLLRNHFTETETPASQASEESALCLRWSGLRLPWLELDWFIDIAVRITELDLSKNCLTSLPSIIPWGLTHLIKIDLSSNRFTELPSTQSSEEILCTSLKEFNVSSNELSSLPSGLLHLGKLQRLIAAKNQLETLFKEDSVTNWIGLRKLEELDVSENKFSELPTQVLHCLKSLTCLNISSNNIKVFPEPWACPMQYFKASNNALEVLPNNLSVFWKTSLVDVDVSDNVIKDVPQTVFQLESLTSLKLAGNRLTLLPPPDTWNCCQLKVLDLSKNQLGKCEEGMKTKKRIFTWYRGKQNTACSVEFPQFLSDSLEVLFLNDNLLEVVPQTVCCLKSLTELYLGNNPGIRDLPPELGQLANLWQLDIEDLNVSNVSPEVRKDGPGAVLAHLRAQLRKAEKCKQLKMIIVGPPRQGKSTLLEILQTGRSPQVMHTDCSINTVRWELQRPAGVKVKVDSVEFYVWDIGGPASMSTVNQCFFTDKALYVVVWNLALGEEAVANLQFSLLNIEAKAPNAVVIVVGTHLDLIDLKFRTERLATLRAYVLALCRSPSGTRATGYPDITFKHLHELSSKSLEGLEGLRRLIFQMSCNIKDVGNTICSQRVVDRLIPRSYLALQEVLLMEKQRRAVDDEVQYLTDTQLDQIIEQTEGNDIQDYEDLQCAISFLIETGTLLHFPDTSHGLRNLYFLDPVWLSECLERIVNIKTSRSVAKNGVIKADDLRMLLVGTGFTKETEEQYFQFLAKFEIALPVASDSYLLPHLLPSKPGMDIHGLRNRTTNTIQRLFKMSFVPVGFWQRFIARMLISLSEMDLQLFENKRGAPSGRQRQSVIYSFTSYQRRNRCSTFRVRRNQTIYWQEGLLVTFEGGYLSVESSDVNWKKKKSGGIKIICQSESRDFSAMAFVTDHVNSLIDQWFPALTATESDGTLLMEQYVPCPYCTTKATELSEDTKTSDYIYHFNMEDCVIAAVERNQILCPSHPSEPVVLQELVPELFMTDFPSRLFLNLSFLQYSEDETNILGQGGSGTTIYKASYEDKPVAIKKFNFKKSRTQTDDPNGDTMMKHLKAMECLRNFSEFRQEASMLHSLQHPCIVSLIGISIRPLCFALQLAPLGSLNTVLSENVKGNAFIPLGPLLTYKISYQIVAGLSYLHKKNIIFCDLKSDNILVWSLNVEETMNIKLSDYGISRQSFHEGALGVEGTPGYQAPEIRPRIVYDEKVDMFSFGMVLYELISGQRPVLGHHQVQIAKKLSKGIRPVLGTHEEVQFTGLQDLMMECWDTKPERRPSAFITMKVMQNPSFATFTYLMPCGTHTLFFPSQENEHTVVFWDGVGSSRNYTVINIEKGITEVQRMSCPGIKLCCQLKTQSTLWLASEDQKIQIYSLKGMCPLSVPQKVMDTPAAVTFFLPVLTGKRSSSLVFAGFVDGLVGVYSVADGIPDDSGSYLCSHTANKLIFKMSDSDIRQNPYPVVAMVVVNSGSEVWYSNGPGILVIDCLTLEIVRRLEPYEPHSLIKSMACNSECSGEEVVWCLDDKTNTLLMYHAASYQLCARYFCGDNNPLRDMFTIQQPTAIIPTTTTLARRVPGNTIPADRSILHSEQTGMRMLSNDNSNTEYCSISSNSEDSNRNNRYSSSLIGSPVSSSSVPFSTDHEDSSNFSEMFFSPGGSENIGSLPEEPAEHLQAVKVLAVKDSLWIPRKGGDIIVISLAKESGRVVAVLKVDTMAHFGSLVDAAVVAKDTVVCCFQKENMEWCLAVWRGWGAREFEIFYRSYEDLGRLEISMRKRK